MKRCATISVAVCWTSQTGRPGLAPEALARLAHRLALGGVDLIKDDHGIADQAFSPFSALKGAEVIALATSLFVVPVRFLILRFPDPEFV